MAASEVRIIGGQWKGRKLRFPAVPTLRPSQGRTRETLFNWLAADIADAKCLDLFAGSGALGFEALSRGAAFVIFADNNRTVTQALKANAALLMPTEPTSPAPRHLALTGDAVKLLTRQAFPEIGPHGACDLIFLDPPFQQPDLLPQCLQALLGEFASDAGGAKLVGPATLIYMEYPAKAAPHFGKQAQKAAKRTPPKRLDGHRPASPTTSPLDIAAELGWQPIKQGKTGDSAYCLLASAGPHR